MPPEPPARLSTPVLSATQVWRFVGGAAPGVIVWAVLAGWLATVLYDRANWSEEADRATVREWLAEARPFRKTLPELVREYGEVRRRMPPDERALLIHRSELREQLRTLVEPTRMYSGELPSFPVIYRLAVTFPELPGDGANPARPAETIAWESPTPHPRQTRDELVRELDYQPSESAATIRCEYQLHAYNKLRQRQIEQRRVSLVAAAVLVAATLLAVLFTYRFLRRERRREVERLIVQAEAEQRQRELLDTRVQQQEAARQRDDLDRKLLEHELEAAGHQKRADEAEKVALEMKSQLYASIGIMAGSYAHNIKNLLVRPNDLLVRCIEADGMSRDQAGMLHEVKSTLGTVTDRLQQILRTVRRDPGDTELIRVDLAALLRDTATTWAEMGRDKWKVTVTSDIPPGPLWVDGDVSHLQQAIENLVFNARDATFEKRNQLREQARAAADATPEKRKQRLIEAAGWKGEVHLAVRAEGADVIAEVRDNGVGMTDEVKANCLQTHYTTKRDNALFHGYSAGMGLGLSFVAMVLEHHGADLTIESAPGHGTTFRVRFAASRSPE